MPRFNVALNQDDDHLLEVIINFSASGNNTVIAGVANNLIRLQKIFFVVGATMNVTFFDGANALTGAMNFAQSEGMILDFDTKPWSTLSIGNPFIINSDVGGQVGGRVFYTLTQVR